MHRGDFTIAAQKLLQSVRVRWLGFLYKHSGIAGFFATKKSIKSAVYRILPKRWKLPGLERPSKRKYGYLLPVSIAAGLFLIISFFSAPPVTGKILARGAEAVPGVTVGLEDVNFGWVRSEAALYQLLGERGSELDWFLRDAEYRNTLHFEGAESTTPESDTETSIRKITNFFESRNPGYAISVEGEPVAVLETEEACRTVLKNLISSFVPRVPEGEVLPGLEIHIEENPRVISGIFLKTRFISENDAVTLIKKGTLEEKPYTVVPSDTIWSISRQHGLTMDDIVKANPELNPDRIFPGDVISLIVPKPFLTVKARYTHIYTRAVPYRTYVSWDPTLYRTESVYTRRGRYGDERIQASVTLRNGLLEERKTVRSQVLRKPVSALLRRGTARTPDDVLIASCFLPEGIGVITSYFGPRWGRFHYGIDVSSPMGTPVHAYKNGRVAFAGYNTLLGNMVTLVHDDGTVTRYGHNDQLLVATGDIVEEGQEIALSGNSGSSTGPHVHFEIRRNGLAMDPLKYLKNLRAQAADGEQIQADVRQSPLVQ